MIQKKLAKVNRKKSKTSNNNLIIKSLIAGIVGFLSWFMFFMVFDPLAGLYKLGKWDIKTGYILLKQPKFYIYGFLIGLAFFLFFNFTLKRKDKEPTVKLLMWIGIIGYSLFYLGVLFLLFFLRF